MTIVCFVLGAAGILYYLFLVLHVGIFVNFGWFWAVTGAGFLLAAFLRKYTDMAWAVWISRIILAALAALFLLIGILVAVIVSGISEDVPDGLEYAVVLGAQVRGKQPSRALRQRIVKAGETAGKVPGLKLVLSGGQGPGEDISEAQCMWNELTKSKAGTGTDSNAGNGIDESRLILEDRSTTTKENLRFSDELTGCSGKCCAIISNDFHLYRALKIARKEGYQDVCGISAGSELFMKPHYFVREAVALLYGKLRGTF